LAVNPAYYTKLILNGGTTNLLNSKVNGCQREANDLLDIEGFIDAIIDKHLTAHYPIKSKSNS
jgi:hypothetical protein